MLKCIEMYWRCEAILHTKPHLLTKFELKGFAFFRSNITFGDKNDIKVIILNIECLFQVVTDIHKVLGRHRSLSLV